MQEKYLATIRLAYNARLQKVYIALPLALYVLYFFGVEIVRILMSKVKYF